MNPLGPLIEKASELDNIKNNLLTAAQEVGGEALRSALDLAVNTATNATEIGKQAVDSTVSLGNTALSTTLGVTKAGLRIPVATIEKANDLTSDVARFGKGLLPALGDRVRNTKKSKM